MAANYGSAFLLVGSFSLKRDLYVGLLDCSYNIYNFGLSWQQMDASRVINMSSFIFHESASYTVANLYFGSLKINIYSHFTIAEFNAHHLQQHNFR